VSTDDGALERRLLRDVYRRAGVAIEDLPNGVFLEWRDGLNVVVNYSPATVPLPLPPGAAVLHGRTPLAPAGVVVWADPSR
jgi:beta-galactosidase